MRERGALLRARRGAAAVGAVEAGGGRGGSRARRGRRPAGGGGHGHWAPRCAQAAAPPYLSTARRCVRAGAAAGSGRAEGEGDRPVCAGRGSPGGSARCGCDPAAMAHPGALRTRLWSSDVPGARHCPSGTFTGFLAGRKEIEKLSVFWLFFLFHSGFALHWILLTINPLFFSASDNFERITEESRSGY